MAKDGRRAMTRRPQQRRRKQAADSTQQVKQKGDGGRAVVNRLPDAATRRTGKVAAKDDARLPWLWPADQGSTTRTIHRRNSEVCNGADRNT